MDGCSELSIAERASSATSLTAPSALALVRRAAVGRHASNPWNAHGTSSLSLPRPHAAATSPCFLEREMKRLAVRTGRSRLSDATSPVVGGADASAAELTLE